MASTAVVPTGPIQDASKPKHTSSTKVEDHAALAALYVTKYDKSTKDGNAYLDGDHRLSSAGKHPNTASVEWKGIIAK